MSDPAPHITEPRDNPRSRRDSLPGMKLRAGIMVIGLLWSTTASADMLGPGEKGVKLSIQVDATVPAGKTLILANTFRGADIITPGAVTPVEWHPLGGDLQIKLLATAEADKLPPLRERRDDVKPITDKATACGAAFPGVRTISDTSPASEVRWTFRATVNGDACTAELVRMDYLDPAGTAVAAPGNTNIPPPTPPSIQSPPTKTETPPPATPEPPVKADAPKPEATKAEASGCNIATPPIGGLGVILVGLLLRRRR